MGLRGRPQLNTLERKTVALGVFAYAATAAALGVEYARVWRRGSAPTPSEAADVLDAATQAASETVDVALQGYRDVSRRENALFNLLASFSAAFSAARAITYLLRSRKNFGPFRSLRVGRRHIHHFVPGILLAFGSGAAAILSDNEEIEPQLALLFGTGMGLTLDESALLLELEDVYWSREGVLSLQISLAAMSLISAVALAVRFLHRGEQLVLDEAKA